MDNTPFSEKYGLNERDFEHYCAEYIANKFPGIETSFLDCRLEPHYLACVKYAIPFGDDSACINARLCGELLALELSRHLARVYSCTTRIESLKTSSVGVVKIVRHCYAAHVAPDTRDAQGTHMSDFKRVFIILVAGVFVFLAGMIFQELLKRI